MFLKCSVQPAGASVITYCRVLAARAIERRARKISANLRGYGLSTRAHSNSVDQVVMQLVGRTDDPDRGAAVRQRGIVLVGFALSGAILLGMPRQRAPQNAATTATV
jgi:hypothetical protein